MALEGPRIDVVYHEGPSKVRGEYGKGGEPILTIDDAGREQRVFFEKRPEDYQEKPRECK